MIEPNVKEMLKDRDLKNGVLNVIIDSLVDWDNQSTQGKLETNIDNVIESTINSNLINYFNKFQVYFITNNFESSKNFLDSFYSANPEISFVVNEAVHNGVTSIKLSLKGIKLAEPLEYYYEVFDFNLKVLENLVK